MALMTSLVDSYGMLFLLLFFGLMELLCSYTLVGIVTNREIG